MSRFRKVDVRVWADAKFCALSANAQLLWMRLLTGPETTNVPGLVPVGQAALAEAMGWDSEVFAKAFQEVSRKGMAKADWKARLVYLPNAGRYNMPESPNVIRSWRNTWDLVPECKLKSEVYQGLKAFAEGLPEGFRKAFGEACSDYSVGPSPNQEQEQEQIQDTSAKPTATPTLVLLPSPDSEPTKRAPKFGAEVQEVYDFWVVERKRAMPGTRTPILEAKRARAVRGRLADGHTVDELKLAIQGCLRTPHNITGKFTDLELICRDDVKLMQFIGKTEPSASAATTHKPAAYQPFAGHK